MTAGAQNYTAVLDVQTYLVPMRFSAMDLDALERVLGEHPGRVPVVMTTGVPVAGGRLEARRDVVEMVSL
jgi:hypothetical protein